MTNFKKTEQIKFWEKIGTDYTDVNQRSASQLMYSRYWFFEKFEDLDRSTKILEVGCNVGDNLKVLKNMGFENLTGIDIQEYALEKAKESIPQGSFKHASILELPFEDDEFDLVFSSGVLIHLHPDDLPTALSEIHRCTNNLIYGLEYCDKNYQNEFKSISYRGSDNACWAADYASQYIKHCDNIDLKEKKIYPWPEAKNFDWIYFSFGK